VNLAGLVRKDFVVCSADLGRLIQCPAAGVYVAEERDKPTFPMWHGIFVHRFLEYCVSRGHDEALRYIRGKKMRRTVACCEAIDPEQLYYGEVEVGWCHDPFDATARRMSHGEWGFIQIDREQFGKADLAVSPEQDVRLSRPLIGDYKCGGSDLKPRESFQLLGLAAAFVAENPCWEEVDVALAGVMGSGEIVWRTQVVDVIDLRRYTDLARKIHLNVMENRQQADSGHVPEFVRGGECNRCKLRSHCPAWM
jgi:hypothetical protein